MKNNKGWLLALAAWMLVFSSYTQGEAADAAADKTTKTAPAKTDPAVAPAMSQLPIIVQADKVYYSDATGDMSAQGDVEVTQGDQKIFSELINGNTKQTEVWVDGKARYQLQGIDITGEKSRYNYQQRTGVITDASGKVDKEKVTGHNIDLLPQQVIIHNGTMTTCPAIVPDYHISAEKVEIWPGDKLIAYNAKFYIKNTMIFSLPKYQKSLKDDAGPSEFPKIGYHSDDGFFITEHLEYPLSPKVFLTLDPGYYTERGFEPAYGIVDREKAYDLRVIQGDYRDGDGNWIKKEPEFQFNLFSRRLGTLPVSYTVTGAYGKWTDDDKTSWHQDYNIYFSHDPIKLDKTLTLSLGTGYEIVKESYNNSTRNLWRYDATLSKEWSPKLTTWTGYHYTQDNNSLFEYDKADLSRELDVGFKYQIDKKNAIGYSQSYDMVNQRIYDQDYTWYRDLHCWQATFTYRAKRSEFQWDLSTTRW